jgi:hypothetical protein
MLTNARQQLKAWAGEQLKLCRGPINPGATADIAEKRLLVIESLHDRLSPEVMFDREKTWRRICSICSMRIAQKPGEWTRVHVRTKCIEKLARTINASPN